MTKSLHSHPPRRLRHRRPKASLNTPVLSIRFLLNNNTQQLSQAINPTLPDGSHPIKGGLVDQQNIPRIHGSSHRISSSPTDSTVSVIVSRPDSTKPVLPHSSTPLAAANPRVYTPVSAPLPSGPLLSSAALSPCQTPPVKTPGCVRQNALHCIN